MPEAGCFGHKNTGQVIRKLARGKVHEVLRSQKFSTDRTKNNCLRAAYLPKRKIGQALFGLLGLNTVYEPPAGQLFFSRGDVLRTLCYTPQTKRQKFQEGPPEEARSSEMPNITFDTSFGSYVTSDKTSDCELILSLCDQAGKGAETVRVFQSSR